MDTPRTGLVSPFEIVKQSWNLYRANFDRFIHPLIVLFVISMIQLLLELINFSYKGFLVIALGLIYFIISIWMNVIMIRLSADVMAGHKTPTKKIYRESFSVGPRYFWVSAVYSLIMLGGIALLIIPGIFWGVRYAFAPIYAGLADKKVLAKESLAKSKALTTGRWWDVLTRLVVPQVFFYFILFVVTFGLGFIATGAQLSFSELSDNFYFDILSTLTSTIFVPLSILPMVILYKALNSTAVKTAA